MNPAIQEARLVAIERLSQQKEKEKEARELAQWLNEYAALPTPEPFVEYATMFKLGPREPFPYQHVVCVNCGEAFLLKDLLDDELNEDQCPACKVWALQFWKDKTYREVPHAK